MKTHIRLVRRIARADMRCDYCPWEIAPYSTVWEPTIGGVALGSYCNQEHAQRVTGVPLEVPHA